MLVAGSVAGLSATVPQELRAAARWLTDAERHLGIEWDELHVWWPSEEELAKLRFLAALRDPGLMKKHFRGGDLDLWRLSGFEGQGNPRRRPDPAEELSRVTEEALVQSGKYRGGGRMDQGLRQCVEHYQATVERNLVVPMMRDALRLEDPVARGLGVHAANLTREVYSALPAMHRSARFCLESRETTVRIDAAEAARQKEFAAISREMLAVFREYRRAREEGRPW
jgi:hypothetical protein